MTRQVRPDSDRAAEIDFGGSPRELVVVVGDLEHRHRWPEVVHLFGQRPRALCTLTPVASVVDEHASKIAAPLIHGHPRNLLQIPGRDPSIRAFTPGRTPCVNSTPASSSARSIAAIFWSAGRCLPDSNL